MKQNSKYFRYYQPNEKDLKDQCDDCVIRALTKALGKTWLEVFDELVPLARKFQTMVNNKSAYEKYLVEVQNFKYYGVSNRKGTKRPTIEEFAKTHPKGTFICRVANHIVVIVDGCYYDTWDSGRKSMYGYWEK